MNPRIFPILKEDETVTSLLGENPLRFYPWARAPKSPLTPYATYGVYSGLPQNYLDSPPDIDSKGTQIDVWAVDADECELVYLALRGALEPHGHMTSFAGTIRDVETNLYNIRMEFDFWEVR